MVLIKNVRRNVAVLFIFIHFFVSCHLPQLNENVDFLPNGMFKDFNFFTSGPHLPAGQWVKILKMSKIFKCWKFSNFGKVDFWNFLKFLTCGQNFSIFVQIDFFKKINFFSNFCYVFPSSPRPGRCSSLFLKLGMVDFFTWANLYPY